MKTHIKHLACLAMLSFIPLMVMGQFRTFCGNFNPPTQSSIVRTLNNNQIIVAKNIPFATFSFIDMTSVYFERMIPLPTNIIVRDFEIKDNFVFFCGDDGTGVAFTGWFDYIKLHSSAVQVFITNHSIPSSGPRVVRLNKMDVYNIGTEYHIVAVGSAYTSSTTFGTIGDISIDVTTNTVTSAEFQIRPNGREYISDVVATNNYVVSVNPNYATPIVYTVKYDKPTVAGSNIFATTTYDYPMRDYVHVAQYMKEGVLITKVGGNNVATLIPYKSNYLIFTIFDCALFPGPLSISQREMFSIYSSNPENLQLKDFTFSPIINEFAILTHDDTCSQISIYPGTVGSTNGYLVPYNFLQSVSYAPVYPFAAFVGHDVMYQPFYVRRNYVPGPLTCFSPIPFNHQYTSMMPTPDTVSSYNYSPGYTTYNQTIATNFYNCGMICY